MSAVTPPRGPRRLVDFFAGIGLAAQGFGTGPGGGWRTVLANDVCPRKAALHRLNHPDAPLQVADIATLRVDSVPEADAWWASSPCQDVSSAGRREGVVGGERSSLAFTVIKLLRAAIQDRAAPPVVVFENVPGLLAKPAEFEVLVRALQGCGYRAGAVMMDAVRWLPASRKRVFLVGVRRDVAIPRGCIGDRPHPEWSTPALVHAHDAFDDGTRADWAWWSMPPADCRRPALSSLLESDGTAVSWLGAVETGRFLARLNVAGRAELDRAMAAGQAVLGVTTEKTDTGPATDGRRGRVSTFRRDLAFTLLASTTGLSRQRLVHVDGTRVRLRELTPREVARLMGAPETFRVPTTTGRAMAGFGDGVAVPVVRHLARHLVEPLVDAALSPGGALPGRREVDWRRPIKAKTVGVVTYLPPDAHARLKVLAREDGVSMAQLVLDAFDLLVLSRGGEPLRRYRPSTNRRGAPKARKPRGRPGGAGPGSDATPLALAGHRGPDTGPGGAASLPPAGTEPPQTVRMASKEDAAGCTGQETSVMD